MTEMSQTVNQNSEESTVVEQTYTPRHFKPTVLGTYLCLLRIDKGLTQLQLARQSPELTRTLISRVEQGAALVGDDTLAVYASLWTIPMEKLWRVRLGKCGAYLDADIVLRQAACLVQIAVNEATRLGATFETPQAARKSMRPRVSDEQMNLYCAEPAEPSKGVPPAPVTKEPAVEKDNLHDFFQFVTCIHDTVVARPEGSGTVGDRWDFAVRELYFIASEKI